MEKFLVKIGKVARHSYAIILPKKVIKNWKWKERQKLELRIKKGKKEILIKDWKPKK